MNMKDMRLGGKKKDGSSSIDADAIRALAELLTETNLTEIEIENGGGRIRVSRAVNGGHYAPTSAPVTASAPTEAVKPSGPHPGAVPSPMVGTVYASPQPGAPPFVK